VEQGDPSNRIANQPTSATNATFFTNELLRRSEQVAIVGNSAKLMRRWAGPPEVGFETILKILLAHDLAKLDCRVPFTSPDPGAF